MAFEIETHESPFIGVMGMHIFESPYHECKYHAKWLCPPVDQAGFLLVRGQFPYQNVLFVLLMLSERCDDKVQYYSQTRIRDTQYESIRELVSCPLQIKGTVHLCSTAGPVEVVAWV